MEQLKKIQELSELQNKLSHGFDIAISKKKNIFEVLLILGQIEDFKDINIKELKKLETIIKTLKRVIFKNQI